MQEPGRALALVVLGTPEPGGPQTRSHKLLTAGRQWREMSWLCVHTRGVDKNHIGA